MKKLSLRSLIPNLFTFISLTFGLTAIKFAIDEKWQIAVSMIVFAAFLDNIDGKLARLLKANSDFGVELDSLSDFISFGIAPAIVIYLWSKSLFFESSWSVVIFYAICSSSRLAKFNLSNYTTKTTTWPKIQEHQTFALFSCVVNTLAKEIILKENFYLKCTPNFYKEVVQELLKRIYLPIYLPVISLIACFLIIKSKESFKYSKLKILLFILGVLTIIISELSVKLASINQLAFIVFLFIPILIFFLIFNIFKMKSKII